jgi:hypothetical protein
MFALFSWTNASKSLCILCAALCITMLSFPVELRAQQLPVFYEAINDLEDNIEIKFSHGTDPNTSESRSIQVKKVVSGSLQLSPGTYTIEIDKDDIYNRENQLALDDFDFDIEDFQEHLNLSFPAGQLFGVGKVTVMNLDRSHNVAGSSQYGGAHSSGYVDESLTLEIQGPDGSNLTLSDIKVENFNLGAAQNGYVSSGTYDAQLMKADAVQAWNWEENNSFLNTLYDVTLFMSHVPSDSDLQIVLTIPNFHPLLVCTPTLGHKSSLAVTRMLWMGAVITRSA